MSFATQKFMSPELTMSLGWGDVTTVPTNMLVLIICHHFSSAILLQSILQLSHFQLSSQAWTYRTLHKLPCTPHPHSPRHPRGMGNSKTLHRIVGGRVVHRIWDFDIPEFCIAGKNEIALKWAGRKNCHWRTINEPGRCLDFLNICGRISQLQGRELDETCSDKIV